MRFLPLISIPEIPAVYQLSTFAGIFISFLLSRRYKNKLPLGAEFLTIYYSIIFVFAVLGAYSIAGFSYLYFGDFRYVKSLISGIFVAWTVAEIVKGYFGITTSTGDPLAPGLSLALCISRLGCLFGHCCYGIEYQGFLALEHHGKTYFPSPLLESFFHGSFFLIILYWTKKDLYSGFRLRFYLMSYCIFRFFSEFLRPHDKIIMGLSIFQIICLMLFLGIISVIINEKRVIPKT